MSLRVWHPQFWKLVSSLTTDASPNQNLPAPRRTRRHAGGDSRRVRCARAAREIGTRHDGGLSDRRAVPLLACAGAARDRIGDDASTRIAFAESCRLVDAFGNRGVFRQPVSAD